MGTNKIQKEAGKGHYVVFVVLYGATRILIFLQFLILPSYTRKIIILISEHTPLKSQESTRPPAQQ